MRVKDTSKKNLMENIKKMEDEARQEAMESTTQEALEIKEPELVDLDTWYYLRIKNIPEHHMKEIIRADFVGRGLRDYEAMETFDKALESYGVKIK